MPTQQFFFPWWSKGLGHHETVNLLLLAYSLDEELVMHFCCSHVERTLKENVNKGIPAGESVFFRIRNKSN